MPEVLCESIYIYIQLLVVSVADNNSRAKMSIFSCWKSTQKPIIGKKPAPASKMFAYNNRNWVFPLCKTTFWLQATIHKFPMLLAPPNHPLSTYTHTSHCSNKRFCDHIIMIMIERKRQQQRHHHNIEKKNIPMIFEQIFIWQIKKIGNFILVFFFLLLSFHLQIKSVFVDSVFKRYCFSCTFTFILTQHHFRSRPFVVIFVPSKFTIFSVYVQLNSYNNSNKESHHIFSVIIIIAELKWWWWLLFLRDVRQWRRIEKKNVRSFSSVLQSRDGK